MTNFQHQVCPYCHQRLTYELAIDRGTVETLKTIASYIKKKGINAVHLTKELQGKGLTAYQIGNVSRLRFHGLIAKIKGEAGNYCLTRKGIAFLEGREIPKIAFIQKSQAGHGAKLLEYGDEMCTIRDFATGQYWEGIGYEIKEGRVLDEPTVKFREEYIEI